MTLIAVLYAVATAVLLTYGLNLLWLTWKHYEQGGLRASAGAHPSDDWPFVTIQLPLYNERFVVERLISSVAKLDYPRDRFEIQVLDDSDDETSTLAKNQVASWRKRGVNIRHVRRDNRAGYKAGALAHGLEDAQGEYVAIFDADFIPPRHFLRRTIPVLMSDPEIGLVQARWGHLNDRDSLLTMVQAALLDTHFVIEQDVRNEQGFFMNFNGTAGVWRASCIGNAGGWESDTLTEDLDLSYRAQLAGWRFRYLADLEVAAEIPTTMSAWRQQQFRWTKGSVETARKILRKVWKSSIPARTKVQATIHLTGFLVFPAILIAVLFHAPLLISHQMGIGPGDAYFALLGTGIFAFLGVVLSHLSAARALYPNWKRRMQVEPFLLASSLGLAVNNTRGILEASSGLKSAFIRTPKTGNASPRTNAVYTADRGRAVLWIERLLAMYSLAGLSALVAFEAWAGVGFQLLFVLGFGLLGWYDQLWSNTRFRTVQEPEAASGESIHAPKALRVSEAA